MRSLRFTVVLWTTVAFGIVGAVATAVAYESAWDEATEFMDGELRQIALNVGEGLAATPTPKWHHDSKDEFIVGIWDQSGRSLRGSSELVALPRQPEAGFANTRFDGRDWRVFRLDEPSRTVQVAQRVAVRRELAESAAYQAAVPILIAIPLAWLVVFWSTGRLLNRLGGLAKDIARRSVEARDPIPVDQVPTEVKPLVEAMNSLTSRLQLALEQQRRFLSDAAHELRTPLTGLHLQIQNLQPASMAGGWSRAYGELSAGISRAVALVQQLLNMARFELPAQATPPERIDLSDLVKQSVADHVAIAQSKGIDLGLSVESRVELTGAPGELKVLFDNLIENAVRYTPKGGSVDISLQQLGKGAIVEVADTGCGVSESELPHLFERFFRAAPPHIPGTGLGLSIAAAIAKRHGLTIDLRNREGGGMVARVVCSEKRLELIPS